MLAERLSPHITTKGPPGLPHVLPSVAAPTSRLCWPSPHTCSGRGSSRQASPVPAGGAGVGRGGGLHTSPSPLRVGSDGIDQGCWPLGLDTGYGASLPLTAPVGQSAQSVNPGFCV